MSHGELFPITTDALKLAHRNAESKHYVPHWAALEHHRVFAHPGCLTSTSKDPHRKLPLMPGFDAEAPPPQTFLKATLIAEAHW
jgi:hypothetical protein